MHFVLELHPVGFPSLCYINAEYFRTPSSLHNFFSLPVSALVDADGRKLLFLLVDINKPKKMVTIDLKGLSGVIFGLHI